MKTPTSPKVTTGGIWAGYATLLLALMNTVTPDSLTFMGHLAPVGYGVVIGGSYALGAWLKEDPLRTAGLNAKTSATVTSNPAPDLAAVLGLPAPAKTFPAAQVDAVTPAPAPAPPVSEEPAPTVTPVYTPPAEPASPAPAPEPTPPLA